LALLFVKYLVKDNISHGISRILIKDIHDLSRIPGSVY
jgi:hypothetical protein